MPLRKIIISESQKTYLPRDLEQLNCLVKPRRSDLMENLYQRVFQLIHSQPQLKAAFLIHHLILRRELLNKTPIKTKLKPLKNMATDFGWDSLQLTPPGCLTGKMLPGTSFQGWLPIALMMILGWEIDCSLSCKGKDITSLQPAIKITIKPTSYRILIMET